MPKYIMFVMTNCESGKDAEFNDWYDRIHLPDVLKVPGVVAAQRYQLTEQQRRDTRPDYGYMAAYEIESNDLPATFAVMNEELSKVYKSPTLLKPTWAYFFKPIGKRQVTKNKSAVKKSAKKKAVKKKSAKPAKRATRRPAKRTVKKGGAKR
jgi:hypothetical protein